jgi:hypothetical protein
MNWWANFMAHMALAAPSISPLSEALEAERTTHCVATCNSFHITNKQASMIQIFDFDTYASLDLTHNVSYNTGHYTDT